MSGHSPEARGGVRTSGPGWAYTRGVASFAHRLTSVAMAFALSGSPAVLAACMALCLDSPMAAASATDGTQADHRAMAPWQSRLRHPRMPITARGIDPAHCGADERVAAGSVGRTSGWQLRQLLRRRPRRVRGWPRRGTDRRQGVRHGTGRVAWRVLMSRDARGSPAEPSRPTAIAHQGPARAPHLIALP